MEVPYAYATTKWQRPNSRAAAAAAPAAATVLTRYLVFGIWSFISVSIKSERDRSKRKNASSTGTRSRCGFVLFAANDRLAFVANHRASDLHGNDIVGAWNLVHEIQHQPFENATKRASACPLFDRLRSQFGKRIFREFEFHPIEREQFGILLRQRAARLRQNLAKLVFRQFFKNRHHRQAADELRNETISEQIFRLAMLERVARLNSALRRVLNRVETHHAMAEPPLDRFIQPHKRAPTNEKNIRCIDPDVLLLRMLAPALRRNIADRPFQDLQERLLHPFSGNIARNGNVLRLARDLVDLVDVNNPHLGTLHIVIGILEQPE